MPNRRRSRDRVKEIVRSAKEKKDRITTVKGVEMKKQGIIIKAM